MKKFAAILACLMILCLFLNALASDLDEDFEDAFDSFRVDPFADFDPGFGDEDDPFPMDDSAIYDDFTNDDEDPFASDDDQSGSIGNAFMSYDGSGAEDEEDPFAGPGDADATPAPTEPSQAESKGSGSMKLNIGGEALELKFDASPSYSSIEGHLLQAAFYTYGADTGNLYEMFLSFSDSVKAGDSLTPEIAMKTETNTALILVISTATEDTYYVASQQSTSGPYPATSNYTLSFDSVTDNGDTITFVGTFTADLVSYSPKTGQIDKTMHVEGATFEFTIAKEAKSADKDDDSKDDSAGDDDSRDPFEDFTDLPTIAPSPTPTMAPDFRRV